MEDSLGGEGASRIDSSTAHFEIREGVSWRQSAVGRDVLTAGDITRRAYESGSSAQSTDGGMRVSINTLVKLIRDPNCLSARCMEIRSLRAVAGGGCLCWPGHNAPYDSFLDVCVQPLKGAD